MAEFTEIMKQKKRMCEKYYKNNCAYCPLEDFVEINCDAEINANPQEAEEIIMKWAEEHPTQSNADKFKEVFGFIPDSEYCPNKCPENLVNGCLNCEYRHFWSQEYKEPSEV